MKLIQKNRRGQWGLVGIREDFDKNNSDVYFKNLAAKKNNPQQEWEAKHDIGIFIDDDAIFNVLTEELGFSYGEKTIDIREDGVVVGSRIRRYIIFRLYPKLNPRVMLRTRDKNQEIGMGALAVVDKTAWSDFAIKFHVYPNKTGNKPAIDELWGTVDEEDDEFAKESGYEDAPW